MTPDKGDPSWLSVALPWLTTVGLSSWAGLVQYIQKIRRGQVWKWRELSLDIVVCSFVGILTHLVCLSAHIEGSLMAVLVAVSAHMGTRAIASMERMRNKILGDESDNA